jgi:hypothetical protein
VMLLQFIPCSCHGRGGRREQWWTPLRLMRVGRRQQAQWIRRGRPATDVAGHLEYLVVGRGGSWNRSTAVRSRGGVHAADRRPGRGPGLAARGGSGVVAPSPKDRWFGGAEEMMTWRGGTHELGREIGKLLEQIVF